MIKPITLDYIICDVCKDILGVYPPFLRILGMEQKPYTTHIVRGYEFAIEKHICEPCEADMGKQMLKEEAENGA